MPLIYIDDCNLQLFRKNLGKTFDKMASKIYLKRDSQ